MQRSGEVEAIEVHHLGPGCDEVVDELLVGVGTSVDFGQGAELGVRAEDEVDTRAGPLHFATLAAAAFEYVGFFRRRLPLGAHVEQVHEEVVGERLGLLGEDAVLATCRRLCRGRACRR